MYLVEDAGELVAALPAVEFGRGFYRRVQLMPDGCYARLRLRTDMEIDRDDVVRCLIDALRRQTHCRLIINDFSGIFNGMDRFKQTVCRTTLVDISRPGWIPPHRSIQKAIRKSEREGIEVVTFDAESHFTRFMDLVRKSEKRQGRPARYPYKFYEALADIADHDQRVRWVWCEHDGRAAASTVFFIEDDMLLSWQSYFDKAFSFLKPNQHILYTEATSMATKGIKFLNQGASPLDVAGVRDYKARWGGVEYEYNSYQLDSGIGKLF